MGRRRRLLIAGLSGTLLLATVACLWIGVVAGFIGPPVRYEVAGGYRGWLEVTAGSPECPARRRVGLWRVVQIDALGRGCTSDPPETGWQLLSHRYRHPDGRQVDVPQWDWRNLGVRVIWLAHSPDHRVRLGFIGTVDELHRAWATDPRYPLVSPAPR